MLRRQSRALMMFAGMMRYRMSNETYTQLVQLGESRSGQTNDCLLTRALRPADAFF